jgi:hypothetical protein
MKARVDELPMNLRGVWQLFFRKRVKELEYARQHSSMWLSLAGIGVAVTAANS